MPEDKNQEQKLHDSSGPYQQPNIDGDLSAVNVQATQAETKKVHDELHEMGVSTAGATTLEGESTNLIPHEQFEAARKQKTKPEEFAADSTERYRLMMEKLPPGKQIKEDQKNAA